MKIKNIILISGIFEETESLLQIPDFLFVFDRSLRCWVTDYRGMRLILFNAGAGFTKRKEFRKLLREMGPDSQESLLILNFGLAGGLPGPTERSGLKSGEVIIPLRVLNGEGEFFSLQIPQEIRNSGYCFQDCLSLPGLTFAPSEKSEWFLKTGAAVCDLELYGLVSFLREEFPVTGGRVFSLKVVSDLPEDFRLYRGEHLLRGWKKASWYRKIHTLILYPDGPVTAVRLLLRKRRLYKQLGRSVKDMLDFLV